ncbi:hypothetical protein CHS0354_008946 [Potamilus streckersoni]|uniref:Hepatocyte growth factor receptor n=1 Tax=Potamilus streckersoni TaxID=2493646 RepID=A0AAE0WED3_9BIVA|nr:hypothetical protein CHS0354_008946 [Potamilus streckersoni]
MKCGTFIQFGVCVMALCLTPAISAMHIRRTYMDPVGAKLQHFTLNSQTGQIFIGATNSIAKLSSDLNPLESAVIKEDNSDVFIKSLLINNHSGDLILCSTLNKGSCQIRSSRNIHIILKSSSESIVPNSYHDDNYAFIGPSHSQRDALYFANTFINNNSTVYYPSISSHNLDDLDLMNMDSLGSTSKSILSNLPFGFTVQYIYGFSYGKFIYIVTTQHKSIEDRNAGYASRIIRLCSEDKYFRSYVELPLECLTGSLVPYNKAHSAHMEEQTATLFVTFSGRDGNSAICEYSIYDIDSHFNDAVQNCYHGNGLIGPPHIHRRQSCVATSAVPDYCAQSDVAEAFPSIEGTTPIYQSAIAVFPSTILTSVLTRTQGEYTVVYLGTKKGTIKKLVLSPGSHVVMVGDLVVEDGQPIRKQMFLSHDGRELYAMTRSKLVKVDTNHCNERSSCDLCLVAMDPICGWCVLDNNTCNALSRKWDVIALSKDTMMHPMWAVLSRCSSLEDCPKGSVKPHWLQAGKGGCIQMQDIQPEVISYQILKEPSQPHQLTFKLDPVQVMNLELNTIQCSYSVGTKRMTRIAAIKDDHVICPLPSVDEIPNLSEQTASVPNGKRFWRQKISRISRSARDIIYQAEPIHSRHRHGVHVPSTSRNPSNRDVSNPKSSTYQSRSSNPAYQSSGILAYYIDQDRQCFYETLTKHRSTSPQFTRYTGSISDHQYMDVDFQVEGRSIVKRQVPIFDCSVHASCTSCIDSSFGCKWCYKEGICMEAQAGACPKSSPGIEKSDSCPRLESPAQDTDILVHSGESKTIAVRVINLQPGQTENVKCLFNYLTQTKQVTGSITSSNLVCEPIKLSFNDTEKPYVTAAFTVTWGPMNKPLDNPNEIKVRIYKCPLMVTNCGQCLSMDPEYECGWCDTKCTLQKHCTAGQWLDRSGTCPNPHILRFSPSTGPILGKTNISVTGFNLGKDYTNLEVTVAGVKCLIHAEHYESSSRFICETDSQPKVKDGVIKVIVDKLYDATSNGHFSFVDPQVGGINPTRGPRSGGTTLTIFGTHMNTGSIRAVDVGGSSCSVISGGTTITVMSTHMEIIQNPEFFVEINNKKITRKCSPLNDLLAWLVCPTPPLDTMGENITQTSPKEVHYGFNLDGVSKYRNISHDPLFGPLLYYPDPVLDLFPSPSGKGMKKYQKDSQLVIKGKFRSISPLMADLMVMVGEEKCIGPASTDDAVTCTPPKDPKGIDGKGNALVEIQIGNFRETVGYLSYHEIEEASKPIALGIILGVVLPIIAIIILLAICVIRRHRKHKPSKNYIPDVLKDYEGKKEEEEVGMNHVSVKADLNGQIPDEKDSGPYIEELLSKIEDEATRQNVANFLIPRRRLDIGDLLGKGNFGVTYKATYSRNDEENPIDVAVTMMQGNQTDADSVSKFLQTCVRYRDLQHPGVLPLLGACVSPSDDPTIIAPYAQNGDLKTYVRDSNKNLIVLELLEMGVQVAEGMAYLEGLYIVHRNLSARNCLVTLEKKVVVSGYGLTAELYSSEQYHTDGVKPSTLIKWLAPESIDNLEFTSRSDSWSYGVLLWELLTRGVTPYPDVDNGDLRNYLEGGKRLKKPRECPENIYQLMLQCWVMNPCDRPTFRQIADEIQSFISTENDSSGDASEPLKTNIEVLESAEFV